MLLYSINSFEKIYNHRYYDPLRLPKAHPESLHVVRSLSGTCACITYLFPFFRLTDRQMPPSSARYIVKPVYLESSGVFVRRQLVLPSSRATPVITCPDLRPRWCPDYLPLRNSGLLLSGCYKPSAFCLEMYSKLIQKPQLYIFRGSVSRPTTLIPPASDSHHWADPRSSLLTCWLSFNQMGLYRRKSCITHWVTIINFMDYSNSKISDLSWHE